MSDDKVRDFGHILDTLAFKAMRPQRVAEQIADRVEAMSSWTWPRDQETRIKQRVDRLAEKYGNLGVSRRKMGQMVARLLRRRAWRRRARKTNADQDA